MNKEILSNSAEERENKLKRAHLITKILNYLSIAILFWVIKFPRPYEYVLIACLAMPIIGIIVIRLWKGLIKIEAKRDSHNPNLIPVFLPGIIFACRSRFDFCISDFSNVWLPVIIITVAISALFFVLNKKFLEIENQYIGILRILLFSVVYSYGAVIGINCIFDKSEPKVFVSKVYNKRASDVAIKTFDIEVSSWKKDSKIEKLSIDKTVYDELRVGGNVSIYEFKGMFNIPWIEADYAR